MTADYKTLLQQKAELEAKIAATLKAEKGGVIAKVRELVEQFGLTQDDIFSTGKAKSASIGVAKYRDPASGRSEEHTSELQSPCNLVCRLLLEKKKQYQRTYLPKHLRRALNAVPRATQQTLVAAYARGLIRMQ